MEAQFEPGAVGPRPSWGFPLGPRLPVSPMVPLDEAAQAMGRTPEVVVELALAGIVPAEFVEGKPVLFRPIRLRGYR